jgi:formylglycine-generating enzyme required for sulfatase activity
MGAEAAWARALAAGDDADRAYAKAARRFEIAVSQDPSRSAVRAQLGRVLYERASRADRDDHVATRDELIERVPLYDPDGTLMAAWTAQATVRIASSTPGASATIAMYIERDGRLELAPARSLGSIPQAIDVPAGSYVIELRAPHHSTIRHPIVIERGKSVEVAVDLPAVADVPDGFAYVAPGWFEFGTSDDEDSRAGFFNTAPNHRVHTDGYVIGKTEVTYGEWIAFLETLDGDELRERSPHAEADVSGVGAVRLDRVDGTWRFEFQPAGMPYTAVLGEPIRYQRADAAAQDWTRMPVTAITAHDAEAYAAWLDRTGRVRGARLCTEVEWERAASGADDRRFPHGHRMAAADANIDITYGKDPAAMGPDEVGAHPASNSPYGIADASGNAFEWTTGVLSGGYVVRGGSYFYDSKTANIANRGESTPTLRNVSVGVRICASRASYPVDH